MELTQTKSNIERLSRLEAISQEEAVNFFYDFCNEVKRETGAGIDAGSSKNPDELLARLPWLGQFVRNLARRNETEAVSEDRRRRLEKLSEQLSAVDKQLEAANMDHMEILHLEEQLRQEEATLSQKEQEVKDLESEVKALEGRICHLREVDVKELEMQKARLEKELEEAICRKEKIGEEIEGQKTAHAGMLAELAEREEELARQTQAKEAELARRRQEEAAAKERLRQMEDETQAIRSEIADLNVRFESAVRLREEKALEKETLDKKVAQENMDCARLREDIRLLEKTLADKDYGEQKRLLSEQKEEKKATLLQYQEIFREVEEVRREIAQQRADNLAKSEELAAQNSQLRASIEEAAPMMEELRKKRRELEERYAERTEALRKKRKELEDREAELAERVDEGEDWLESLEGAKCRENVKVLEKRLSVIEDARQRLAKDLSADWASNRYGVSSKTAIAGDKLQKRIKNMQMEIASIREALDSICACISSEKLDG